jgi:hypothetical protein
MLRDLMFKELKQIPTNIRKLLGKPPVLSNENLKDYESLELTIVNNIKPDDIIAWLYVNDVVVLTWEIFRLRGYKVQLTDANREKWSKITKQKMAKLLGDHAPADPMPELDNDMLAFHHTLDDYERIDSLLASAEIRRNAYLRELERHNERLAYRFRRASDDFLGGVFTEHHPSSEPVENEVGIPANDSSTAPGHMVQASVIPATHDPGKPISTASGQGTEGCLIPADPDPGKPTSGPVKKGNWIKKPTISPAEVSDLSKAIGKTDPDSNRPPDR